MAALMAMPASCAVVRRALGGAVAIGGGVAVMVGLKVGVARMVVMMLERRAVLEVAAVVGRLLGRDRVVEAMKL